MIGEVGLLTRNVKIKGHDDGNLFTQSFGARVLVGLQTDFSDPTAKDFLAARGRRHSHSGHYHIRVLVLLIKLACLCILALLCH